MSNLNRRKFLGSLPCLALGSSTVFSSLINLKSVSSLLASSAIVGDDYKALVCVLLRGGNDSYNMLVPTSTTEYNEYAQVRSNQSIAKEELLSINPITSDGREFGIHPSLTGMQRLFDAGNVAFVCNVGTLIEPLDAHMIANKSGNIPVGLLSHSDQVMHWQTAFPQDRSDKGWGGKIADIMKSMNVDNGVSMNISLGGNNIFQSGKDVVEYAINNDGAVSIAGWEETQVPFFNLMREDITEMVNKEYEDVFKDSYRGTLRRSIDSNELFNAAIAGIEPLRVSFGSRRFSQDLKMVANSIAARKTLGMKRQIFFVELGGFDNHDELINNHAQLLRDLDEGLSSFYEATQELGLEDCVTTFTISDFARTLTSNGNGTDHAWGGNAMVMGGAVKGKDLYGTYPELGLGTGLDVGGGVLVPTTSADEYFAELALWYGLSPNDMSLVLPNLGNFYSFDPQRSPLQFLS